MKNFMIKFSMRIVIREYSNHMQVKRKKFIKISNVVKNDN